MFLVIKYVYIIESNFNIILAEQSWHKKVNVSVTLVFTCECNVRMYTLAKAKIRYVIDVCDLHRHCMYLVRLKTILISANKRLNITDAT